MKCICSESLLHARVTTGRHDLSACFEFDTKTSMSTLMLFASCRFKVDEDTVASVCNCMLRNVDKSVRLEAMCVLARTAQKNRKGVIVALCKCFEDKEAEVRSTILML